MPRYLFRRTVYSLLVLWGVATLVFVLFSALPRDPARPKPGQRNDPASVLAARRTMHLDKRVGTRYMLYLNDLSPIGVTYTNRQAEAPDGIHITRLGDSSFVSLKAPYLGRSFRTKRDVGAILGEGLPGTIVLGLSAMLIAVLAGVALGLLGALKKDTPYDTGAIAASVAGISMPSFFAGLVLAYVFAYLLSAYTGLKMTGSLYAYNGLLGQRLALQNLILPAIALSIRPMAVTIRLTRSAMLDVLSRDYIRTAYAMGLSKTRVVLRHALPNALNPVLASIPVWLAELLAGAFFIETIFGWKGIGRTTVDALVKHDFPLIMGATLLMALIFIIVHLISDIVHSLIDPRARV